LSGATRLPRKWNPGKIIESAQQLRLTLLAGIALLLPPILAQASNFTFTSISITAAELRYGCARKGSPKLLAQIEAILESVQVLALDVPVDAEYGGIRAELEAAGKPIGPNDLFIATHAYALGAVLVTANAAEFTCIRALQVENWLA
jgi:tRNA(fMet)-specific endonuclease VapC